MVRLGELDLTERCISSTCYLCLSKHRFVTRTYQKNVLSANRTSPISIIMRVCEAARKGLTLLRKAPDP
jgi:hypothetical protein